MSQETCRTLVRGMKDSGSRVTDCTETIKFCAGDLLRLFGVRGRFLFFGGRSLQHQNNSCSVFFVCFFGSSIPAVQDITDGYV